MYVCMYAHIYVLYIHMYIDWEFNVFDLEREADGLPLQVTLNPIYIYTYLHMHEAFGTAGG